MPINNYLFSSGLACVNYNGKWGYVNSDEFVAIDFLYDYATAFVDGYAILEYDYQFFAINSKGESLTKGYNNLKYLGGGYFAFYNNKGYGVIDSKDKVVIDSVYDSIASYTNNVFICKKDGYYGLVNKRGKELTSFVYSSISDFSNGLALAKKDGLYGFLNNSGKEIIPFDYSEANSFIGNYAYVKIRDEKYLINNRNKIGFIIDEGMDINNYDNNYVILTDELGKYFLYNYARKELISDSDLIIMKNGSDISYIASLTFDSLNLPTSFNIYKYNNFKKLASSNDINIGYKLAYYYFDYVTCYLYFRYMDTNTSTSLMYCFDGNKLEICDILTSYFISEISNGIVVDVDSDEKIHVINGTTDISNDFAIVSVSYITSDGYIIYNDGLFYGAFDKLGNNVLGDQYTYIKTLTSYRS